MTPEAGAGDGPFLSLAFVIARFPPALGGTEQQAASLAGELARAGHRVLVLTQALPGAPRQEQRGDVEVVRLHPVVGGKFSSLFFGLRVLGRLLRRRPDVVQAFLLSSPALFAGAAGRLTGRPVLVKVGGSGPYSIFELSGRTLSGRLRRKAVIGMADRLVAPSLSTARALEEAGVPAGLLEVIPNGVDLSRFSPLHGDAEPGVAGTVVFSGRLEKEKDPFLLLEAWKRVVTEAAGSRLILVGDGSLRQALEREAHESGIASSVVFAGEVPHGEMPGWYRRGAIFALPSRNEGLCNALLEAAASGLAPVASDIPTNRDLFPGGRGCLFFPVGDADALAVALLVLLRDDRARRRLSLESLEASRRFSIEASARGYAGLYRRLTAPAKVRGGE